LRCPRRAVTRNIFPGDDDHRASWRFCGNLLLEYNACVSANPLQCKPRRRGDVAMRRM